MTPLAKWSIAFLATLVVECYATALVACVIGPITALMLIPYVMIAAVVATVVARR